MRGASHTAGRRAQYETKTRRRRPARTRSRAFAAVAVVRSPGDADHEAAAPRSATGAGGRHAAAAHARWLSERAWQSERLTARGAPHGSGSTRGSRSGAPCSERRADVQVPPRAASAKSKARRALELRAVVRPKQKTSCRYVSETCDGASSARFRGPARNRRGAISSSKSPETRAPRRDRHEPIVICAQPELPGLRCHSDGKRSNCNEAFDNGNDGSPVPARVPGV